MLRCRVDEVGYLTHHAQPLLGFDPLHQYTSESKFMRPGTTLLFYTDGLIEDRHATLDEGMQRLWRFVETLDDLAPVRLCEALSAWRAGWGPQTDDICVFAVRTAEPI